MDRIAREIGHFLVGLGFLTRLPVPAGLDNPPGRLARATPCFPLVGVLVGCAAAAVLLVAGAVLPVPLAAGFAIAAGVLFTGALHEDGFADCCDGLGGGRDRQHALDIMRDSRIGSYGTIGLVLSFGLRWTALAGLAPQAGAVALIVAHAVSRGMLPPVLVSAHYARDEGLASAMANGVSRRMAAVSVCFSLGIAMLAGPICGLVAFLGGLLAAAAMLTLLVRRLGGYTGDGLGAVQQLSEIAVLAVLAGCWG